MYWRIAPKELPQWNRPVGWIRQRPCHPRKRVTRPFFFSCDSAWQFGRHSPPSVSCPASCRTGTACPPGPERTGRSSRWLPLPPGEGRSEVAPDSPGRSHDTSRIAWAKLVARIAEALPLACSACGGDIRLIAFITDPAPIRKILLHLGEPLEPTPLAPARGSPTSWDELVQVHDDRDAIQASPDDLPVIDIRSL